MPCLVGMSLLLLLVAGYRRCQEHRKKDILLPLSTRHMALHGPNETAAFRRSRKSILENNGKSPDFHDNVSLTPKVIVHSNGGHSPYVQQHRFNDPLYDDNGLSIGRDNRDFNKALITDGKETSQIRVFVHPHRMTPSPRKPSSSTSIGDSDHDVSYGEINPVFQADDDLDGDGDGELDGIFLVDNGESTQKRLFVNQESVQSDVTSDGGMTSALAEHSCRSDSHSACDSCKEYEVEEGDNGQALAVTKL
eukprot:XP_011661462.1 PREDICTED: uncharacterized protein LOC105437020 [Strongylocentrotus purpuratus]